MVYGAASVCKGINLRGREAYATVPNKLVIAVCVFVCVVVVGGGGGGGGWGRVVTPACRILPGKALPPLRLWYVYHKIRGVHLSPFWGKHPPTPTPPPPQHTHTHSVSYMTV